LSAQHGQLLRTWLVHAAVSSPFSALCAVCVLPQGKLCQLVQLVHSMSFLTGGLAGIMAAYRPAAASQAASGGSTKSGPAMLEAAATPHAAAAAAAAAAPAPLSVESLMSAVGAAVDELPVWESPEVEQVGAAGTAWQCSSRSACSTTCFQGKLFKRRTM
jgi:hypothetical protein